MDTKEFLELIGYKPYLEDDGYYSISTPNESDGEIFEDDINYIPMNATPAEVFAYLASEIYGRGKQNAVWTYFEEIKKAIDPFNCEKESPATITMYYTRSPFPNPFNKK